MRFIPNRYLLVLVALAATVVLVYVVGIFYQSYINNPLDFAALVFIVGIYAGAVYHHLQRSEG